MKRFGLLFVVAVVCLLSATLVGAQALPEPAMVTIAYDGKTVNLHNGNLVFTPGDTKTTGGKLTSPYGFSVLVYANMSALEAGDPAIGGDDAECTTTTTTTTMATTTVTECALEIKGSDAAMVVEIFFTPVARTVNHFSWNGTRIGFFYEANPLINAGNTPTQKDIVTNKEFFYETYGDWGLMSAGTVISQIPSSCSTLTGVVCSAPVIGTSGKVALKILWGALAAPVVSSTAAPVLPAVVTPAPAGVLVIGTPVAPATVVPATTPAPAATPVMAAGSPLLTVVNQVGWTVGYYSGTTAAMKSWTFPKMNVDAWDVYPNVDNPKVGFVAANGLEYAEDETQTCGVIDDLCNITVPPLSYILITGDYSLDNGIGTCKAQNGRGCALVIFNVGTVSSNFKGILDNAFIVQGRTWNGNTIPEAASAVMSHASHNMTNAPSALNPAGIQNAGGNCSVATGCPETENQIRVVSGNEVVLAAWTNFKR